MSESEVVGREYLQKLVNKLSAETERADEAAALLNCLVTACSTGDRAPDGSHIGVAMPSKYAVEAARAFINKKDIP